MAHFTTVFISPQVCSFNHFFRKHPSASEQLEILWLSTALPPVLQFSIPAAGSLCPRQLKRFGVLRCMYRCTTLVSSSKTSLDLLVWSRVSHQVWGHSYVNLPSSVQAYIHVSADNTAIVEHVQGWVSCMIGHNASLMEGKDVTSW